MRELNICIATKAFAALILDYEWPEIDGVETREKAIEMFISGAWREA